ncbi:MAG: hypothetical protein AB1610_09780 [Nitrospirota bacterium]
MRISKKFPQIISYISLYILLCSLVFLGCGGGKEYSESDGQAVEAVNCSECHITDIQDTHYQSSILNIYDEDDPDLEVGIAGYMLESELSWAPEGMGYVLRTSTNACAASCHDYHDGNIAINNKWYMSGHADKESEAFAHEFTRGACLLCHSGMGYASYVDSSNTSYPGWTAPTDELYSHIITCNACHDGQGYPSSENKRLRKTGSLTLTSGSGTTYVEDATLDVGDSAACFVCHQGRESGASVYKTIVGYGFDPYDGTDSTMTNKRAVTPHYASAGAMLFSLKGYEFPGKTYSNGIIYHQIALCTGCHMADSSDPELGGHTFNVSHDTKMNIEVCQICHSGLSDFETFRLYERDMDGDGTYETIKDEIEGLKTLLINQLATVSIYYNPDEHPYFFADAAYSDNTPNWTESQFEAAFNLAFVDKEHGAYVHNFKYAAQLLWDSCEILGVTGLGTRPDDTSATDYTTF